MMSTPNIRDLIARTLADHSGGEGTWDRLTTGIDPQANLTSQERARRAQVYRDAAEAVRVAMFAVPCGSCHPCENWVGEMWRRADRKPPYPEDWDTTRTRLASTEAIARAAVALCADLLRRYERNHPSVPVMRPPVAMADQVETWGQQVLAWQDQLDQQPPDPEDLALPDPDLPGVQPGDRLILACDGRTWTRIYGEHDDWTEVTS
jgi:hypothetical protein